MFTQLALTDIQPVARFLIYAGHTSTDDIVSSIGHRPFEPNKQYAEFISNAWKRQEQEEQEEESAEESGTGAMPNMSPA